MQQPAITYDAYYAMCDAVSEWKLKKENIRIEKGTIERYLHGDIVYSNLLFLTWLTENNIIDDKNMLNKINKIVLEKYRFDEEDEEEKTEAGAEDGEEAGEKGKTVIMEGEYKVLEILAKEITITGWEPKIDDLEKYYLPYVRYGAGFFIMLLVKYKDQEKRKWYKDVKSEMAKYFTMKRDEDSIYLSREEFDRIIAKSATLEMGDEDWWPRKEDIIKYMLPNLKKSIPFLVYLLNRNCRVRTAKDAESKAMLQNIYDSKISMMENGGEIWR